MAKTNEPHKLTPMERQYQEIKSRHLDKILFFRLGDFYEMFNDDAKEAARILNIALTSRHNTPMCGFPHHAASSYIQKLVAAGKKVAICEQTEDPSKAVGIVKRDIVNIITPGTIIDENFISRQENNYLCVLYGDKKGFGLSFADISTGEFFVIFGAPGEQYRLLQDELARFSPSEIIYNQSLSDDKNVMKELVTSQSLYQSYPDWYFNENQNGGGYLDGIKVDNDILSNPVLEKSIRAAFHYLLETQMSALNNIKSILLLNKNQIVEIDDFTLRNLELVKNMQDGGKKFTLLDVLDETVTPMGGRLLRRWIVMPLRESSAIYRRQNFVEAFFEDSILTGKARETLKKISDIERLTTRIALKKAIPRDLKALSNSLKHSAELKGLLNKENLSELNAGIIPLNEPIELIDRAIQDEPSSVFGGNVIKTGFDEELDKLVYLMREGKDWIIQLQARERNRTGINSLKIKYNKVLGYFIEVSKANLGAIPDDYNRKQSLVNSERYTIPELSDYETQITTAAEKAERLEEALFNSIVDAVSQYIPQLQSISAQVAEIDVYSNLAEVAGRYHYVKPRMSEDKRFHISEGRHPVVEKYMGFSLFVPNDTLMDDAENRLLIITGPNMAGKSTYLRQNALIAVMAQMGSYIPAKKAEMSIVDKIFTRIGASDQLSAGRSTFLVEMEEAANILNNATDKSLIIMDELGRGTSTYDGLSIAWAVIEYLHEHPEKGGKTLFATHYHELTQLGEKRGIRNFNIAVKEYQDELIFLRKVVEGPADRSYGIYVAKLAGINDEILKRANVILENLESEGSKAKDKIERAFDREYGRGGTASELQLFPDNQNANTIEKIRNIDLNRITPIEAITFLSEIQRDIGKE